MGSTASPRARRMGAIAEWGIGVMCQERSGARGAGSLHAFPHHTACSHREMTRCLAFVHLILSGHVLQAGCPIS
jgi:hypothetical protein